MKHLYIALFSIILLLSFSSCSNKINYQKLGFDKDVNINTIEDVPAFDNHAPSSNSLKLDDRIDYDLMVWDRILDTDPSVDHGDYNPPYDNKITYLAFDKDKIRVSPSGDFKPNNNELMLYYLEVEIKNNVPKLTFELMSESTTMLSSFIRPQIDIIESNGIYSYSARRVITGGRYMNRYQSKIQIDCYNYFWAIAHTKNFPYSVYFNQDMILFISRNRKFDKKALNLDRIDDLLAFLK